MLSRLGTPDHLARCRANLGRADSAGTPAHVAVGDFPTTSVAKTLKFKVRPGNCMLCTTLYLLSSCTYRLLRRILSQSIEVVVRDEDDDNVSRAPIRTIFAPC